MKVSVILATYCPTIERYNLCKRSFREVHQTGLRRVDYELIVVNNGGLHRELIDRLGADVVLTSDHNLGQGRAMNAGASIARSKYNLAFIDDDLSFDEGWLREGLKLLNRHPTCVISLRDYGLRWAKPYKGNFISDRAGGIWIMRRSLYKKIGSFSEKYDFGGLWTRNLIRGGHRFVISKTPFIHLLGEGMTIDR